MAEKRSPTSMWLAFGPVGMTSRTAPSSWDVRLWKPTKSMPSRWPSSTTMPSLSWNSPDPVGSIIMVKGRRFLIVGVIETNRTGMMSFQPEQTEIWVPFSTARRMQSPWSFFYVTGQVKSPIWWTKPPQKSVMSCGRCGSWDRRP